MKYLTLILCTMLLSSCYTTDALMKDAINIPNWGKMGNNAGSF